jgi:hypothetical protein
MTTLNSHLRYRVVAVGNGYHWLDRATNIPVPRKDGSPATFASLDEAINAFIDQQLAVTVNEPMGNDSGDNNETST